MSYMDYVVIISNFRIQKEMMFTFIMGVKSGILKPHQTWYDVLTQTQNCINIKGRQTN